MSATNTPDPPADPSITMAEAPAVTLSEPSISRKSYRRKYRKIMVNFERKMQESNSLFRDEQKILDVSQRLAEQTDQLLQLLVELNSMPQVPQRLRFDLDSKHSSRKPGPETTTTYDEESGHKALRKARYQVQIGEITPYDYESLKNDVADSPSFAPSKAYASLTEHAPRGSIPAAGHDDTDFKSGYLTVRHEEQYLANLDAYMNGEAPTPRRHAGNSLSFKNSERNIEKEKEVQLRNPVSVYNWLRKNQPQVFLQDDDNKPSRAAGTRNSKRNSTRDAIIKQEQEQYDEEGVAVDGRSNRGKRKRIDQDGGYRPKGGNSRTVPKRKRESKASIG